MIALAALLAYVVGGGAVRGIYGDRFNNDSDPTPVFAVVLWPVIAVTWLPYQAGFGLFRLGALLGARLRRPSLPRAVAKERP